MVLITDDRLAVQIDLVQAAAPVTEVVALAAAGGIEDQSSAITEALVRHRPAVPVALGGGSVMDAVRLAALAVVDPRTAPTGHGSGTGLDGVWFLATEAINPTVCIPSTIGTASEVSPVAIRQGSDGTAMILSPGLRSAAAIHDPRITGTLPVDALAAGLVEPWARIATPAVAGEPLRLQDGLVRGLASTILTLGDEVSQQDPDDDWRRAAAWASVETHLGLIALGRAPAGHLLWPLATEVTRVTRLTKAGALAALVPAWLRCLAAGLLGRTWGSAERVVTVLELQPSDASERLECWLRALSLPTTLPADTDVGAVTARVLDPWQTSGLFLTGATQQEIAAVVADACSPAPAET